MKKFKLKALVLVMVVMMGLTLVPNLYAANKYTNDVALEEADIVCSLTPDKTELNPGDTIAVTLSVDKLPDEESGYLAALRSMNASLVYDANQIELLSSRDDMGRTTYDVEFGPVGEQLGLDNSSITVRANSTDSTLTEVLWGAATSSEGFVTETGDIITYNFKVKDTASGDITLFLLDNSIEDNGFSLMGVQRIETAGGYEFHAAKVPYYVHDNLTDQIYVPVPLTGVEFAGIDKVDLDKTTQKSFDLSSYVSLIPSNTTDDDELVWSEDSDGAVVTVANGVVTAVGNGTANVTVTCGEFSDTIPVNVTTSVGELTFGKTSYTVDFEETVDLGADLTIGPDDAQNKDDIEWSSDNTDVATVDENGVVTGVAKGTANITVTVGNVSKTVPVTVAVPLKSIVLSTDTVTLYKGETSKVGVTAQPEGAVWDTLEASLNSGAEFAEVKEVADGVEITGVAEGNAVVAISANGNETGDLYKLVNVEVKENKVTSAVIENEEGAEVLRGETLQMNGSYTTEEDEETVHPSTDDTTLVWESLNPDVATVDENGVVTAVKEGTATIKLTVAEQTAEYVVTVKEIHVDGVVISDDTLSDLEAIESVTVGDVIEIPFTVTPEGTITDTVEEIVEFIKNNIEYDEDLVDVTVEYNKETGEGKLTITVVAAGEASVVVTTGDPEAEDTTSYEFVLNCVEPVVEEVEEELPDTGDMPVAMIVAIMAISVAGIVASRKIFVK